MAKSVRHNFMIGLIDFFLLNVALFSVQLIKRGNLELSAIYIELFGVLYEKFGLRHKFPIIQGYLKQRLIC